MKDKEIEDLKSNLLNIPTLSIKESLDNVFATKFSYHHFEINGSSRVSEDFIDNKVTDTKRFFTEFLFQSVIPKQYNDYVELCNILEENIYYTEEEFNKMLADNYIRKYDKEEFLQFFKDVIISNKNR